MDTTASFVRGAKMLTAATKTDHGHAWIDWWCPNCGHRIWEHRVIPRRLS